MVESKNSTRNPLLEQVEEKRRREESQKLAQEMLPAFRVLLGNLISAKVPTPEVETVRVTASDFDSYIDKDSVFGRHRKLGTKLIATIPLEGGETSVTISASGYPEAGNVDLAEGLDYEIDVNELDRVLIIRGAEVRAQSKKWESEPFTRHTPIGVPVRSWPSWSRLATLEDLQAYATLLEMCLTLEGVTFKGSTPPIVSKDYTEIRSRIKLPRVNS